MLQQLANKARYQRPPPSNNGTTIEIHPRRNVVEAGVLQERTQFIIFYNG